MGAIMAIGVAVANAILLVTFAEQHYRKDGRTSVEAGVEGARTRVRPILMTSLAMIAGMTPMALGLGEGGDQTAPLGRAVIGGLLASTLATLTLLPAVFALVMGGSSTDSVSLSPTDPESRNFVANALELDPRTSDASENTTARQFCLVVPRNPGCSPLSGVVSPRLPRARPRPPRRRSGQGQRGDPATGKAARARCGTTRHHPGL